MACTVSITFGKVRFKLIAEGSMLSTKTTPLTSPKVLLMRGKLGEMQFSISYTVRALPSWEDA
jgi:hypothetical protein